MERDPVTTSAPTSRWRRRSTTLAAVGLVAAVIAATAAFATTQVVDPVQVDGDVDAIVNQLYPTGAGDVTLEVTNPNPWPVQVTAVVPVGAITSNVPACDVPDHGVTFPGVAFGPGDEIVDANSARTFVLDDAAAMSNVSPDACQDQTFLIPVEVVATTTTAEFVFTGFDNPVSNLPVVNVVTANQAIPIKWHLTDLDGNVVSDPASFVSVTTRQISCSTGVLEGEISDPELASGNSGLQYHGDGNWQYNWKTPRAYQGQCRLMYLTLNDGTSNHLAAVASFRFR